MSDQDRARERNHWQAIAEQLGLSPEPDPVAEKAAEPIQSEMRAKEHPPAAKAGVLSEKGVFSPEATEIVTSMEDEIAPDRSSVEAEPVAAESERAQPPRTDDERRSGKHGRRPRRGRGVERASSDEGQEDAAELPSKDEENEGEGVPAPRRERGRQKQARSSREADEDANAEVTAADAESQDENDDVE